MRPRRVDDNRSREPQTRINEMIRVREVLLINEDGVNQGNMPIEQAQQYAIDKNLDLVEISPQARPPVCRVMDYGKWKYEQNIKAKEARKHRSTLVIKEIKFRPKIGVADYETKKNHVRRFLDADDKVKVTIMFRGREVVHSDLGRNILNRVAADCADMGSIESHPNLEGRNMTMMLAPLKNRKPKEDEEMTDTDVTTDAAAASDTAPTSDVAAPAAAEAPAETAAPAAETEAPAPAEAAPAAVETPAKPTAKKKAAPAASKQSQAS